MDGRPSALPSQATAFRLLILGPFALVQDGSPADVGGWQRQAATLFRMLATSPQRRRSRDEVIDLLWPEATPSAGASNLRRVVHLLRRALHGLDPTPILTERDWIALNPVYTWEVDLERFELLARTAGDVEALEEVAALYRGEPLPEDRYEEWARPIRERAQREWRSLCLRLARAHLARGARETAVLWLERRLESDPLDEEALQTLLPILVELGRKADALRTYRRFEQLLDAELGVPPTPETQSLIARLKERPEQSGTATPRGATKEAVQPVPVVPSYPLSITTPMIGRERDLAAILERIGEGAGCTRMVLIGAEAGMGKTRLLAEVAERARAAGALTLAGGSYEEEGRLPYGPVHDALLDYVRAQTEDVILSQLDGLLPDLARIIPELRSRFGHMSDGEMPEADRLQLFAAVSQALERLARPHPLILILDDLHWADEATFQLLHFLLRQPSLSRVSLIGAYRVEEVVRESPLARLVSSLGQGQGAPARGATLGLPPFERKDLSVLLEILLSGPCAPSLVESLYERSEGNPFFTKQMVSLLRQQERLEQGEAGWRIMQGAQVDLPPAVRETVTRRLRHLTAQQREVLTFGAVLGREFPYAALEAMWGRDEAGLFSALDAAVEAQLIGETESGYSFHHPLLREAIYSQVPRARRPLVHGRAGLALETLYVRSPEEHAAELAHHFHLAGRIHPERALLYLTLAGDHAAAAYASREAAAYYHAALTYAQEPRATADLQVKLGNTLTHLSQYDRALTLLEEAAAAYRQLGARADEGRAVAHIGRVHVDRGTAVEGTERVEGAVRSLEGAAPTEDAVAALGRLHGILFHLYAMSDRPEQSSPAAEEEVGYARRLADDRAMASAELHRGMALLIVGRQREALRAMEDIAPLVEKVGNLDLQAQLSLCLGQAYLTGGEVGRSKPHVERDLQLARMRRGPDQIAFYMSNLCEVLHLAGDWRLARELGLQALDLVRSEGRSWYAAYPPLQLGRLALYEGAWQDAAQRFAEALAIAEPGRDVQAMKAAALGLGELDLLQGRPHAALERLIPLLERLGREGPEVEAIWGAVAWAHLGMADSAHAAEAVAHGVELATRRNNRLILPDLLRVHGMVLSHERACRRAHEAFDEATRLAHAMPYPYAEGRALYEHGRMLAEAGDIEEARTRWTQALCIFRRLGARPYSALTERAISAITA